MMNFYHLVNPSVAFHATHPPINMNGMIEIDIVRSLVNADPRNGMAVKDSVTIGILVSGEIAVPISVFPIIRGPDWLEEGRVALDVLVAGHADVGRGNAGTGGLVDGMVTITAVQSELTGVEFVIVRDGLSRLITDASILWSGVVVDAGNDDSPGHAQGHDQFDRYGIDPARKNITHEVEGV